MDDLNVGSDESYLPPTETEQLKQQGWRVLRLINGYGRYLRNRKLATSSVLHDAPTTYSATPEISPDNDPFAD